MAPTAPSISSTCTADHSLGALAGYTVVLVPGEPIKPVVWERFGSPQEYGEALASREVASKTAPAAAHYECGCVARGKY